MPGDAGIARPFEDRGAGELSAIIADDAVGFAVNPDHPGQLPCHARVRKAGIGDQPLILTGARRVTPVDDLRPRQRDDLPPRTGPPPEDRHLVLRPACLLAVWIKRGHQRSSAPVLP